MSGTFPSSPAPATVRISSHQPTLISVAHSLKRQVRTRGAQRWGLTLTFPPMTRAVAAPLWAFLVAQKGQFESFQITLPGFTAPLGIATGTPLVDGAHAAGVYTVATDGWTASQTGIVKAGDYIKFSGHTKVYMVTADANSGSGVGAASLSIMPKLVAAVANNEAITISSVPFTVQLASDTIEVNARPPVHVTGEVSLIEAY